MNRPVSRCYQKAGRHEMHLLTSGGQRLRDLQISADPIIKLLNKISRQQRRFHLDVLVNKEIEFL